ncbi:MAG TPA: SgcJ/EcaC family oxidoreductase [Opitutaceae bacterium]|nr:SgcJ/EcaC family oxidoreductase [Opitutaceae bacterium]
MLIRIARKVALILVGLLVVTESRAQSPTAESVASEFITAWNNHEAAGFERLFTEKAIWVPVAEVRDEGRDAILKDLMIAHTSWAKRTRIALEGNVTVQLLKPDVAVIFFKMKFLDSAGNPIPTQERAMILVTTKDNAGWRIASGQLTKESPPGR